MECKLLSLPRELRDAIWGLVLNDFIETTFSSRNPVAFYLLLANRQIREEVTTASAETATLNFKTNYDVNKFQRLLYSRSAQSSIFLKLRHISVLPMRTLYSSGPNRSEWHHAVGSKSALNLSSADWKGWHNVTLELTRLLRLIRLKKVELRTLEIPATALLNVSIVRQLRRLRGVTLHFAFESEVIALEQLNLDGNAQLGRQRGWLGEDGDVDILLPIYESSRAMENSELRPLKRFKPIAMVPFASFTDAIRRDAASTDVHSINVQQDVPLWIDFEANGSVDDNGMSPPTSNWYIYSCRDPGVLCLEQTTAPDPPMSPRRKQLRRSRHDLAKALRALEPCRCHDCCTVRNWNVESARAAWIERSGIKGVLVKNDRNLRRTMPH